MELCRVSGSQERQVKVGDVYREYDGLDFLGYRRFCLVVFYGTSTIVGYLWPNPFLYI